MREFDFDSDNVNGHAIVMLTSTATSRGRYVTDEEVISKRKEL